MFAQILYGQCPNGDVTLATAGGSAEIELRYLLTNLNGRNSLNSVGRMLAQQKIEQETTFDLSGQPAGIYWVDLRFDNKTSGRQKIMKE